MLCALCCAVLPRERLCTRFLEPLAAALTVLTVLCRAVPQERIKQLEAEADEEAEKEAAQKEKQQGGAADAPAAAEGAAGAAGAGQPAPARSVASLEQEVSDIKATIEDLQQMVGGAGAQVTGLWKIVR
jgi:hypothetical protein